MVHGKENFLLWTMVYRLWTNYYLYTMDKIPRILAFLEQQPKDNFLRHALALEYVKIGKLVEARELFEAILTDSPDYVGSYYHLAKLLEQLQETDLAIQWYEKGMEAATEKIVEFLNGR